MCVDSYFPGQRGFEEAEVHDSRKMSTLILRYAREHQMGKYTLVASNQLGTAESNCDLIVRYQVIGSDFVLFTSKLL